MTDPAGNVTTFTYGGTAGCSCNGIDQLTAVTDPNGNTSRFNYDAAGRKTSQVDGKRSANPTLF